MALAGSAAFGQDMSDMPGMGHGQMDHGASVPSSPPPPAAPPAAPPMPDMGGHRDMAGMGPTPMMSGQLGGYSMMRDASGTAWQPDSTPMQGVSWAAGGWTGMVHGYADLVYDRQGGPRGGEKTFSESMLMVMAQHALGPGTLTLRSMLSLDPLMGRAGYPLLFQTGETADGVTPLVDRQHPHDFLMELAAVASLPVGEASSVFVYVGYPGEPALGPPTFMHRFSGMDDPAAPISHHWLDSTHITFGVVTAGVTHGPFKLEGSVFNGREPDQQRWGWDPLRLDSWSVRASLNPSPDWAFQVSYGVIHSPEQLEPDVDQRRVTASASYNRPFRGGNWQTTLAWGRNENRPGQRLDALLLESAVNVGRHTVFGRAESVQKDELFESPDPLAGRVFRVSELTLGYVYELPVARRLALGLGVQATLNLTPPGLEPAYGASPGGYMPFARVRLR